MCCFVLTSFHHLQILFIFLGGVSFYFNTLQLVINRIQDKFGMFLFCIVNMFHKVFIHSCHAVWML